MKKILTAGLMTLAVMFAAQAWALDDPSASDYPAGAQEPTMDKTLSEHPTAPSSAGELNGRIVSIDKIENEIVVHDEAGGADKRVKIDPNVLASTTLGVGDRIRVVLSGGSQTRAESVNLG